ncbi:MAG: ShlB/FhaC/HecB family hemolysin secretion/activation protein [Chlorobiaceae bacterium]|nr:ShlB/FhaC/HecB family hemolysin secretion/activation protein [Chlorobiaceae bacterium]
MLHLSSKQLRRAIVMSCLLVPFLESGVLAAPPDAGQILRGQQPQRQIPQLKSLPERERVEEYQPSGSGVRILVKGYRFTGFEALASESELLSQVADTIGKELNDGDLNAQLKRVDTLLRKKGWFLAESYLPEQDVSSGIIEISLSKNISDGSMTFSRQKNARISKEVLAGIGEDAVKSGYAINERQLERSLLIMNELPGVTAFAQLATGNVPGSTGVAVEVSEGALLSGGAWADNYGNYYTGQWRTSALVNINDPSGRGDQISVAGSVSDGFREGKIAYSHPLGSSGLKGALIYSPMSFEMGKEISDLKIKGQSQSVNAGLSYPLVRSRLSNITLTAGYEYKLLSDSIWGLELHDRSLNSCSIGLKGYFYDKLLGGGYNTWNANVTNGMSNERLLYITKSGIQGSYMHANLGLDRLQQVTDGVTLNVAWTAQFSPGNLDSSERFYLGGPFGVRAYPVGEASGDAGHLLNVDLSIKLPVPNNYGTLMLGGFYDAGRITTHINPWPFSILTDTGKNSYWLQGAGLELSYFKTDLFSIKSCWAHVIGENSGRDGWGRNADGKKDNDRFWLIAALYF